MEKKMKARGFAQSPQMGRWKMNEAKSQELPY
jgi:hypothetical protein